MTALPFSGLTGNGLLHPGELTGLAPGPLRPGPSGSPLLPVGFELAADRIGHEIPGIAGRHQRIGIDLGREDETSPVLRHVPVERIDEGNLVGHLLSEQV